MTGNIAQNGCEMIEYRDAPSVLVLADSVAGAERARQTVERIGGRVCGTAPIEEAGARLDRQAAVDAVLLELEQDHGALLDGLLDRLDGAARAERHGSVIVAPIELIDQVAARTPHRDVIHLCGASELDRASAIILATRRRTPRLHDVGRDPGSGQLQRLSEEVGRIAAVLASLSATDAVDKGPRHEADGGERTVGASQIRAVIRARRLRDHYFSALLFADPAWDMLLDLMAARLEGREIAVSSLCIAAAVPPTTALRWIKTLTDAGLCVRSADPRDGRRVYIDLSAEAAEAMAAYLAAAFRSAPLVL